MLIVLVLTISVVALALAVGLARCVLGQDNRTPELRVRSDAIQKWATALLTRQSITHSVGVLELGLSD